MTRRGGWWPGSRRPRRRCRRCWQQVDRALADVPALVGGRAADRRAGRGSRLDRANLIAAIRATLAADAEGEADPLYYLRDEVDEQQVLAGTPGGDRDDV